jgi:transposase-like protein
MTKSQNLKQVPNPEVKEPGQKAKRRKHTAKYKLRILKEADMAKGDTGAISALLRKEGLYSSFLTLWRKQRDTGALAAFSQKRGVKSKSSPKETENERLKSDIRRLEDRLRQANLVIEAQKKISEILGIISVPQLEETRP